MSLVTVLGRYTNRGEYAMNHDRYIANTFSNLLRTIVSKLSLKLEDGAALLPFDVFRDAGNLSFEQLSNLRHRGAFSTVSLTFAKCCQLSQETRIKAQHGESLLQEWYKVVPPCAKGFTISC